MKKIFYMILAIILLIISMNYFSKKVIKVEENREKKIKIITTLFPSYDFSKEIGKEKVEVELLLPPGIEPHSFEPSPRDVVNINKADIFIYTGKDMEPWVEKLKNNMNKNLLIIDLSQNIELLEHEDDEEEEDHHGKDPHIWTDPKLAELMIENITEGIIIKDKLNEEFYKKNMKEYKEKLDDLDFKIREMVKRTKYKKVISGGHFAFSYFFKRYDLEFISPYKGFAPNAEPKAKDIAKLREAIDTIGIKYIYYEELVDPKIAKILADEAGINILILNAAHNVSKEDMKKGIKYLDIMEENIKNLKLGLEYEE